MNHTTLNDKLFRMTGAPLCGILITLLSGIVTHSRYSRLELIGIYTYFILLAFIVWQGNLWWMYYVRRQQNWFRHSYYRVTTLLFTVYIIYSGLVSFIMIYLWRQFSREDKTTWQPHLTAVAMVIVAVVIIVSIYEIIILNRDREYNIARAEKLNTARVQAELEALKNQVSPHFIFNSLNTLSYLITREPESAKLFNDTLAKVYRYILTNKDKDLVALKEEIEFVSNYFYLLKIRYTNRVNMEIELTDMNAEHYLIPPISLQLMIENAIKHNNSSEHTPLIIRVSVSESYVIVENRINPKPYPVPTSRIGLENLNNRYKLITSRNIVTEQINGHFIVKLPVLKF
jgi:sensor histidine kinase YesM